MHKGMLTSSMSHYLKINPIYAVNMWLIKEQHASKQGVSLEIMQTLSGSYRTTPFLLLVKGGLPKETSISAPASQYKNKIFLEQSHIFIARQSDSVSEKVTFKGDLTQRTGYTHHTLCGYSPINRFPRWCHSFAIMNKYWINVGL